MAAKVLLSINWKALCLCYTFPFYGILQRLVYGKGDYGVDNICKLNKAKLEMCVHYDNLVSNFLRCTINELEMSLKSGNPV